MTVLITGASGFIGSNLYNFLLNKKVECWRFVRDSANLQNVNDKVVYGDISNLDDCKRAIAKSNPDIVYHLAAQSIVGIASKDPIRTFESNIAGTYNMLEAVRLYGSGACSVVIASSDKAYGEKDGEYYEDDPMAGRGIYDVSKSCTDLIAQSYSAMTKMKIGIVRSGNVYGPGDRNASRIIPSTIKNLINGTKIILRSDGSHVRNYIHVSDVVKFYEAIGLFVLSKRDNFPVTFNIAGNETISVLELVNKIIELYSMIYKNYMSLSFYHPQKPYGIIIGKNSSDEIKFQSLNTDKFFKTFAASFKKGDMVGLNYGLMELLRQELNKNGYIHNP